MKMPGTVFFCALALLIPSGLHAQSQPPPCTVTLSYSPAIPVVNQPFTATATVTSPVPLSGNMILDGLVQFRLVPPFGGLLLDSPGGETQGGTSIYTFVPNTPGPNTLIVSFTPLYSFGAVPVCGGNGVSTVVNVAASNEDLVMNGQYTFYIEGTAPSPHGLSAKGAEVGSITMDGKGNITAGVLDLNTAELTVSDLALTGSYSLDSLGHGTLTLVSAIGTQHLGFFMSPDQFQYNFFPQPSGGSLFSIDGGIIGNGFINPPVSAYISPGHFAFALRGDSACNLSCGGGYPISVNGLISFNGDPVDETSVTPAGVNAETVKIATMTNAALPTGRFTLTVDNTGSKIPKPLQYVVYPIEHEKYYIMSLDPHSSHSLLSGLATQY